MLVAGVDSSTQCTKVLLCQAEDGTVVARGSALHPPGTECPPAAWWSALEQAGAGLLTGPTRSPWRRSSTAWSSWTRPARSIRPALLWNDLRSAPRPGN